jgi:hypothetical protein
MAFRFVNNNRNIDSETPSCVHMLTFFNIFLILGQDLRDHGMLHLIFKYKSINFLD